ncbi:2-dehydro-3-deoxy-phosphogluconate aldolase [Spiroplasma cantharicola]|uniref:2-keto-3-deoxy-6-phosphogluconate aldolase n=1 Tax=Spiroplasma cantharicola TaxID=362837 RepID=A0A0M4JWW2_9MOLU|nr:KDGP aldolase family protein [Spiroplasma cantharicola]ALD66505.1 2-keto-3-deoxy-6-phosphogluconate aldolase [Spiroplasma cantharicola]
MNKKKISFYKNRVCLNVLAKDLKNAKEIIEATEGNVVVGILSKNFPNDKTAYDEMTKWKKETNNKISIGLGAGDPNQSYMVARLSKKVKPAHANQVFTGVGLTVNDFEKNDTFINCLVSPTGKPGYVKINTGPLSSSIKNEDAIVEVNTAIQIIKDMGGDSIKFFPMNGMSTLEEYKIVARACARNNFSLEPTGGIDLENFEEIIKVALDEKVPLIIPHVYNSIIDKQSGETSIEKVKQLYKIIRGMFYE